MRKISYGLAFQQACHGEELFFLKSCNTFAKIFGRCANKRLKQEETFEVNRGTIRFRINGQEIDSATGQTVVIPAGTRHILWNASDEEASMTVWLRPALKTEIAFETLFGLTRDGKTNKHGLPNIFQTAVLLADYPETQVLLPSLVQIFLKLLTPLARLIGYRSSYKQYSSIQ